MKIYFEKLWRYETRDKTAHFSVSSPSAFVATRRRFLPAHSPRLRRGGKLFSDEVRICARRQTRTADTWFFKPVL